MNNELLKQELIEKESLLNTISNHRYKTDFCYLGSDLARANVLDEALNYTFLRSKESLEAYNRECKRVDELNEWISVLQSRLKSEYERGYNQGMAVAAKETD